MDTVTLQEAQLNGWVANYKEYLVLIDVEDINLYQDYNKQFTKHFEFFNYDFNLAMSMLGPKSFMKKIEYRD